MSAWERYASEDAPARLVQLAILHAEVEALHRPLFYISAYFEARRDAYHKWLFAVSRDDDLTDWCRFFLEAAHAQAVERPIFCSSESVGIPELKFMRMETGMRIKTGQVYVHRTEINRAEAPFERYRDLAYTALNTLDLPLPTEGKILLKPNATVLYPPEKRIVTHPGFLAGMLDALVDRGVSSERLVVGDGQSGEQPDHGRTWEGAGYTDMAAGRGV